MNAKTYIIELINGIPHDIYELTLIVFFVGTVLMMGILGMKRGLRYSLLLFLVEYILLIYCSTIIFRKTISDRTFELSPFWSYRDPELLVENLMNITNFIPIGLIFGLLNRNMTWIIALLIGFCLSFGIESMQFVFKKGFSEIDDVIHNTFGCLIGFIISIAVHKEWSCSMNLFKLL